MRYRMTWTKPTLQHLGTVEEVTKGCTCYEQGYPWGSTACLS